MRTIRETLHRVSCGETVIFKNLAVTPLVLATKGKPDYLTLDEALARGQVRVTETSEAGDVPELLLDNRAERPVLLVDGEELVGAKQNRVLNLTILAPPKATIRIPVSCVEAGRWAHSSPEFSTEGRAFYAAGRARKASHITESLRSNGTRRSRQGEVWDDIREKSGRMESRSATEAMASLYEDYGDQVDAYIQAIDPVEHQVGAVFAINGRIRGIELFDFAATLRKLYPKLVRSYALDAIDEQSQSSSSVEPDPWAFVAAVAAADGSTHAAVGEGMDIRLSAAHLAGGALEARERLVHLCAFSSGDAPTRSRHERSRPSMEAETMSENHAVLNRLFREDAIRLERSDLFDRPAASKGPQFDFDRVEGMLLGIAVGDALGVTTEGRLPETRCTRHGEIRDYLPNRYVNEPRGFPSDDTQLSFWALEQMINDGGFDPERVARRFCSGRIFGIGETVRKFIRDYKAGKPWYACGPASAGNGAMMRIAPVLIPHLRGGGTGLWADAALAAMLTHNDRASTSACVAFVGMLWDLLDMDRPPEPRWWLDRYVALAQDLEGASAYAPRGGAFTDYRGPLWRFALEQVAAAYEQRLSVVDACRGWYSGAYLLETLPSVLYILMRYGDDPEEAIIRAVNDTKDNDTIAAIVGAAVGALHGRQALPNRWIENLSGRTTDRDDGRVFELIADARRVFWTGASQQSPMQIRPATPDLADRARAALLAHACGDRFGAPLEFVRDRSVRTREVHLDNWTDDTHMSLYLGEAILAHGPGPLESDRFGEAVGDAFVRWLHDPLMPSTAPGSTCMAGVRHFGRDHDWKTCGIQSSDGCGAVMRIVPLALAFHGDDLLEAARISAIVTHAHPNALEAAIAGAWLVRQVLDTGCWDGELVEEAIRGLDGPWSQGGNVADSLRAALAWVQRGEDWLDERMIPPGDGGWRSGSALGLAVAAALRWPENLELAVEKAARIQGDSDSVACLTGALLGAALGMEAIPPRWLATLPRRTEIAGLAGRLVAQAATGAARQGPDSPLVVIGDLHGHLDLFEMLLATIDQRYPHARIVTLGDYVDNGPRIRALLDRLIDLKAERPDRFFPILGNHDLALLRALGWPGEARDGDWYDRWRMRYWNAGLGTPEAYGADDLESFKRSFPLAHYRFLASMPWYYDDGEYCCVHAGLHRGAIAPQRASLEAKELPDERLFLPHAIRNKDLATLNDPTWERVVVSSHTHLHGQAVFSAARRVCVSATSDHGGGLLALVLPERRCWRAAQGEVVEVAM